MSSQVPEIQINRVVPNTEPSALSPAAVNLDVLLRV